MPDAAPAAAPLACSYCRAELGPSTKVQPTMVDKLPFCPTCIVWHRMHREPARFPAAPVVVRCGPCGWESISLATGSGNRRACGVCQRLGVAIVRPDAERMTAIRQVGAALRAKSAPSVPPKPPSATPPKAT